MNLRKIVIYVFHIYQIHEVKNLNINIIIPTMYIETFLITIIQENKTTSYLTLMTLITKSLFVEYCKYPKLARWKVNNPTIYKKIRKLETKEQEESLALL